MKRLIIVLAIFSGGTGALLGLHRATLRVQQTATEADHALLAEIQQLAQARIQRSFITQQIQELKQKLDMERQTVGASGSSDLQNIPIDLLQLTAAQSERLLAELGFSWSTTGDYLIVSKNTLRAISLDGMRGSKIGEPAVQVLAITPEERAGIEAMSQGVMKDYSAWTLAHAQRIEPTGDVVANYILPADSSFSQSLSNNFANGVIEALGAERGKLLLDYSRSWMQELGMGGADGTNSFSASRYPGSNEPHYSLTLRYSGNMMNTDVSPYQEFPPAFLPLFPNGWPDLAQREGFELPKEFRNQK